MKTRHGVNIDSYSAVSILTTLRNFFEKEKGFRIVQLPEIRSYASRIRFAFLGEKYNAFLSITPTEYFDQVNLKFSTYHPDSYWFQYATECFCPYDDSVNYLNYPEMVMVARHIDPDLVKDNLAGLDGRPRLYKSKYQIDLREVNLRIMKQITIDLEAEKDSLIYFRQSIVESKDQRVFVVPLGSSLIVFEEDTSDSHNPYSLMFRALVHCEPTVRVKHDGTEVEFNADAMSSLRLRHRLHLFNNNVEKRPYLEDSVSALDTLSELI